MAASVPAPAPAKAPTTVTVWLDDQKVSVPFDSTTKVYRFQIQALEALSTSLNTELNPFDYRTGTLDPKHKLLNPEDTLGDSGIIAGDALRVFQEHQENRKDIYWATGVGIYTAIVLASALDILVGLWPWSAADLTPAATRLVTLYFLIWKLGPFAVGPELLLLYIVLLSGIIGACIWSLYALSLHVSAAQDFDSSWVAWYLARPLLGAGLAGSLYALLRAGLFSPTSGPSATDVVGVAALGFLVGLFAENAIHKLHDIADTLFGNPPSSPPTTSSKGK